MERYIGLDVHSTNCTCVVISPTGRKTKEVVLETTAPALREFVRTVRRPSVVVMEEGNQSDWLYEVLSPVANEVLVIQPSRRPGNKRDDLDAERCARLVRLNEPGRVVYKAPLQLAALRQATKAYRTAQKDLIRNQARLKLLLQSRGLMATKREVLDPDARKAWISKLPKPMLARALLLGAQIDAMIDIHQQAEKWMFDEAKGVRAVQWVKSIPAIGDIRAPMIVSAIVSPHRFRTKRQLWRYAGLGVDSRSSNDWVRQDGTFVRRRGHELVMGLNRDRNPVLKEALVGAAQLVIQRMTTHPLHHAYQRRVAAGMKPSNARLTLTRKLAAIVLAVWKKEQKYDPKLIEQT